MKADEWVGYQEDGIHWFNIARVSYDAYAKVTGGKNYQGLPMPQFEDLPDKIQEAWIAAVKTATEHYGAAVSA